MAAEPIIAFASDGIEPPGLEIRVNFGVFAGREATPAEIDELASELLAKVEEVSIVSEQRHEISEDVEAALHQVRIEIEEAHLPADEHDRDELRGRLLESAERWAVACFEERRADVSEL
jgi:hypothetical protein